jgi:hypothetical protein
MRTRYFEDGGGVGGGADTFYDPGYAVDVAPTSAPTGATGYLSSNYTPQDSTQRQFYQPVYEPSYQNYNLGNPMAVSQYGQDYSSPFGQFVNPFSYAQQMQPPQFSMPQMGYMGGQGIAGLNPFGDYGMEYEGMTSPNYGIAGLYR